MSESQAIPKNFLYLHQGEEELRAKSLLLVERDPELTDHLAIIESAMNLLDGFVRLQIEDDDDGRAVQHLGIRMFNGFAASWKLIAAGYYQMAAMIQRDQVETINLISYFHNEPEQIAEWRIADRKTLINKFGPSSIRKALDAKAGWGKSKRGEIYQKFSALAGHPTKVGFGMLRPTGMDATIGPFTDLAALRGLLEEAAQLAVQAGYAFLMFVDIASRQGNTSARQLLLASMSWSAKYLNMSYSDKDYDEIERLFRDEPP